jgi:two-component sensor histidine kinase
MSDPVTTEAEIDGAGGSVRRRLVVMLLLAIAPAMALAIAYGMRTYGEQTDAADRRFVQSAVVAAQGPSDAIVQAQAALITLSAADFDLFAGRDVCNGVLADLADRLDAVKLTLLISTEGRVQCASNVEAVGADLSEAENFRSYITEPHSDVAIIETGAISREKVILVTEPILRDGSLRGLLTASIPAAFFGPLQSRTDDGAPYATQRAIVARGGEAIVSAAGEGWLPAGAELDAAIGDGRNRLATEARDGRDMLYAIAPLLNGQLWVVAGTPQETLYDDVFNNAALPISAPMLMLLIAVFVAYVGVDRLVVRHIIHLTRITRAYGQGRLGLRPRMPSAPAELAMLGAQLADMADRLETREDALRKSARDNRLLLLEVYHRVKNNLQLIASLLQLEARRAAGDGERRLLQSLQSRIFSLSLVHERLYSDDMFSAIHLAGLLQRIAESIAAAAPGARVSLDCATDTVIETPDRATPVALWLNEAMTNAVKHLGGDATDPRVVRLQLRAETDGGYTVTVANPTGPGPAAADPTDAAPAEPLGGHTSQGLGGKLMAGFVAQLRAEMTAGAHDGAYTVSMRVPPAEEAPAVERDWLG